MNFEDYDKQYRGDDPNVQRMMRRVERAGVDLYSQQPYMGPDIGTITSFTVEKLRVMCTMAVNDRIEEEAKKNFHYEKHLDYVADVMVHQLKGFFWSHRIDKWRVEHPKTWRDAVKVRFFPKRLLARFPAAYQVYEIDVRAVYPGLSIREERAHPYMDVVTTREQAQPLFFEYPTQDEFVQRMNPNADPPNPGRFTDPRYAWTYGDESPEDE